MARTHYSDYVYYTGTSHPVVGVPITVFLAGTTTPASLFDAVDAPLVQPLITDVTGYFEFYVDDAEYDIYVSGHKASTVAINSVEGNYAPPNEIYAERYASLALADAAAVAAGRRLVISTQFNTVPATLEASVRIIPGGKLNNSGSLSIDGPFEGCDGCFIGSGVVTGLKEAYSEWFGAKRDGITDDGPAFRKAIAALSSKGEVKPVAGTYAIGADSADNTAIYIPSNIYFNSTSGTTFIPYANDTVMFRIIGMQSRLSGVSILNPNAKTSVSGIRLAPIDENGTTLHSDIEFNDIENIHIRNVAEAIVLRPGPSLTDPSLYDSYLYYNTFKAIDIRNCTRGIWLAEPVTQPGSGANRNTFISVRIGETGANTGVQIDAGDTNKFFGLSLEGIASGTSPNIVPTAIKIAYNSASFGAVHNQFFGLTMESCTRDLDNDNDLTEFYGYFNTGTFYYPNGRKLAVDMNGYHLNTSGTITAYTSVTSPTLIMNDGVSTTKFGFVGSTAGTSSQYNGVAIASNRKISGDQGNASLPSWIADIGGLDNPTYGNGNAFGLIQQPAGGTAATIFRVKSNGVQRYFGATATTVGAAGGASALPATPVGYIKIDVGGTEYKIPYYAD